MAELHWLPIGNDAALWSLPDAASALLPLGQLIDTLHADERVDAVARVYESAGEGAQLAPTGELYMVFSESTEPQQVFDLVSEYCLQILEQPSERELVVRYHPRSSSCLRVG